MLSPLATGVCILPFSSISDPGQVAVLTAVLKDICSAAGIEPDSTDADDVAQLIVRAFWDGHHTAEELRQAIARRVEKEERRYG